MRYNNYHKHDCYGNPWIRDVAVKPEDYINRAKELGHTTVFTTNHAVTGSIFDWLSLTHDTDLKLIYGMEAYYVPDRFEKDKSNKHIVLVAKNNDGYMQLNKIMSASHSDGFYYRPRIDNELLFSLEPKNFIVTTACVAGIWDEPELLMALKQRFGENFFLEIQPHNIELQKTVNARMLEFGKNAGIQLIHANDSHYIFPGDQVYREIYLRGHDILYKDDNQSEQEMILDYPDSDTIFQRYEIQGVVGETDVHAALQNTLVFDQCEKLTVINDNIKLPSISEHPNEELKRIINDRWLEERKSIPREKWKTYLNAIREEVDIVEKTNMANYFLIDYHVVKMAQDKYGGRLTNTGRGSAPSFYITKMLGLTDIDRVSAPVTLFPSRFMSVERIVGSRSLPDVDLNTTDRQPFIKATEELLGKENCAWMLSWKPLQDSSAFRLYCKGTGLDIKDYDEIAKDLDSYRNDKRWADIIEKSKKFVGVIDSVSESPCSMVLYDKPVDKEIGLVRTSKGVLCCLLDGYNCDKYKYLKNDYLTVTVWAIIKDTCELAGIPIPTIREIDSLFDDDTFKIYENGLTCSINQADSAFGTALAMRYKPRSVSEMSAFVAIIRPGCASLLQDFVDRKPYTTGVQELDDLLIEGSHRMIYQELIMKYLIWLGIPETGSYDIIKKIAKKKFKEEELAELKGQLLLGWMNRVGRKEGFEETWSVVEDAARYSFNSSHSLSYAYDSLYGAYLKSHYPLEYYTVALNYYRGDSDRTLRLTNELSSFQINLKPIKFRYSRSAYALSREDHSIYKGIESIKEMNAQVAEELYELRNNTYDSFITLLFDIQEKTSIRKNQMQILIELDYFSEFGDANKLMRMYDFFNRFAKLSMFSKEKLREYGVDFELVRKYAGKETEKNFLSVDFNTLAQAYEESVTTRPQTLHEKVSAQIEYTGYVDIRGDAYSRLAAVLDVDTKYTPKLTLYSLKNGTTLECKVDKRSFNRDKLVKKDIIRIIGTKNKPKSKKNPETNEWEPIPNTSETWITSYSKILNH